MENKNHISDELLAAYLDGNTSAAETREILEALRTNPELRETIDIALKVEHDRTFTYDVLPMRKLAAKSGNNICSVLCEAFVLHKRGIPFNEQELLETAQDHRWLTPQGSPLHSIGLLLAHYGLMVTRKYDARIEDIQKVLALDNDVIVVVDSGKLYPERSEEDGEPNHALVVTEIKEGTQSVVVFDPQENATLPIPISQFELAWNESRRYMVRVLQSIDDYDPQPIQLENIQITNDLLELREAIAENAHEVWAATKIKEGWSYGVKRDDTLKKHPDLIPYSVLPDSEKEYDRIMAMNTIKLVKRLGFDLVKRKD